LSILAEALAMRGVRQDDILAIAVWELPEKLKQIIVGGIAVGASTLAGSTSGMPLGTASPYCISVRTSASAIVGS